MKFKRIVLRNIRSYEDEEIIFPEGSLLLSGNVGSGKTSILLAMEYALFGLQPGQKGSSLLRNNISEGQVILELEIDGTNVIIERKLKRNNKTVTNDYAAISIGSEKYEASITEIKTIILDLIGYPIEFIKRNNLLYRYTVFTPQEQMKQIILEDPEIRLNIIRHIFGIDKYKRIRENLDILLTFFKEESKLLQGEIKNLDQDKEILELTYLYINQLQERIHEKELELVASIEKRKKIETDSLDIESKIKEKDKFEREVEKTNILILSKKENLASTIREISEISRNIAESSKFDKERYNQLIENINEKQNSIDKNNSEYIHITSQLKLLEQHQKSTISEKERILNLNICYICRQPVTESHKHIILNEAKYKIEDIQKTISSLEKEKEEISQLLSSEREEKNKLTASKVEFEILKSQMEFAERSKVKLEDLKKKQIDLEKDINLLSTHINELKAAILAFSKFDKLSKIKLNELKNAALEERKCEIGLAELKKEIELKRKEILNMEKTIELKEKSRNRLSEIQEISNWLSTQFINLINFTERTVLLKIRAEFSKLFEKWVHLLASDSLNVQIDENFTPLIIQNDSEMEYSFLSGGERTAIALAYRLALNQTINSVLSKIKTHDIVILDEPTEGFSDQQTDKIRDILKELNIKQLIIVSHEQKIEGFVDNVIKIKKIGNASYIESPILAKPKNLNTNTIQYK